MIGRGAGANQLRVVPLHAIQCAQSGSAMLTDFAADLVHPKDRGSRVWAGTFWNVLKVVPALSSGPSPASYDFWQHPPVA